MPVVPNYMPANGERRRERERNKVPDSLAQLQGEDSPHLREQEIHF